MGSPRRRGGLRPDQDRPAEHSLSEYEKSLATLFARTGATSKFGLERTQAFLTLLGNPHDRIDTIHVAGTNGKGSVVATLYALLRAKGLRVGRYTSPHLIDFRERIVVDDVEISGAEVVDFLSRWAPDCERLGATFFEITTALAFHHFASKAVDIAIIETGLGGRLDATNVITPLVAGVTSISVEHTEYLGDTLEMIAAEKGGIFKRNVPAVFGPMPDEARKSLIAAAARVGVSELICGSDRLRPLNIDVAFEGTGFDVYESGQLVHLRTGLVGAEQAANACTAMTMLNAAGPGFGTIAREAAPALLAVHLQGRFQRVGKIIFDVAHNPDSMAALIRTLAAVGPPRPIVGVLGILRDKDWKTMIRQFSRIADRIVLTQPPSAPDTRAWDVSDAAAFATGQGWTAAAEPDFRRALHSAVTEGNSVVVTGSFHTVGDALTLADSL
ncbi:MAG: folylpolyglutamate synthase/dihydrofolate synthase family protein [Gemmatimonadaceae bacterium]